MTTEAKAFQSRQLFTGKACSQATRQDTPTASARPPKLMDRLHEPLRPRHYRRRTNLRYYPFYGSGYVQFIWKANYERADRELEIGGCLK
jgi:hypothetical protein